MKIIACVGFLWVAAFAGTALVAQTAKSVNEGVFTAAQADRGAAVFKTSCTACHEPERFVGKDFLSGWTGKPLQALFTHVSTMMPEDNPGSLKPQQYADVVAYFLKLNGYPAGKEELAGTPAALKAIKFDQKAK